VRDREQRLVQNLGVEIKEWRDPRVLVLVTVAVAVVLRAVGVWLRHPSTVDATCAQDIDSCA
jgi:multidrug resistance efflux pump